MCYVVWVFVVKENGVDVVLVEGEGVGDVLCELVLIGIDVVLDLIGIGIVLELLWLICCGGCVCVVGFFGGYVLIE